MKRTIKLNESELKRMISESVKKVLREGTISNNDLLSGLKDYVSQGDLESVLKSHPQLVDVIANWLLENGEDDFLVYIGHNFTNPNKYV